MMKKKKYSAPEMIMEIISAEDIITTSVLDDEAYVTEILWDLDY